MRFSVPVPLADTDGSSEFHECLYPRSAWESDRDERWISTWVSSAVFTASSTVSICFCIPVFPSAIQGKPQKHNATVIPRTVFFIVMYIVSTYCRRLHVTRRPVTV